MKPLNKLFIGTVLGAVVILGVAATTPKEPQKWEYLQVLVSQSVDFKSKVYDLWPEGKDTKPAERLTQAQIFDYYGNKGWEYVGEKAEIVLFKRPKN